MPIYLIHRRDEFRGEKILQDRVFKVEEGKIQLILNSTLKEVLGEEAVSGVSILNDGSESKLTVEGVYCIHTPNTGIFQGKLDMKMDIF